MNFFAITYFTFFLSMLPSSLPDPLVIFLAGVGLGSASVITLYEKFRLPPFKELRVRLNESEPQSSYRNLTNKQLKNKINTHTRKIRDFIELNKWREINNIMRFIRETDENGEAMTEIQKEYRNDGLHLESLRLRDELWARLPVNCQAGKLCENEKLCNLMYKRPFTFSYLEVIATDLQRLSNHLKI